MDDADRAQAHIERELEARISAARGILPPATESADECVECGELIPSARQVAVPGCQLCTHCADTHERMARLRLGL
jgi:phage/conjugal plasmid C-4 type zinc finger TraR family protein